MLPPWETIGEPAGSGTSDIASRRAHGGPSLSDRAPIIEKGRPGLRVHTRIPPSAALIIVASGLAALARERRRGGQR